MKIQITTKTKIGILGGMGPQASCELLRLMIDKATIKFGAQNDGDFPEIILDSVPVPDFISDTRNIKPVGLMIRDRMIFLSNQGCDQLAIACNTAHIFEKDLIKTLGSKFVSLIELVAREAAGRGMRRVAVLATPTTIKSGLYTARLGSVGIEVINPAAVKLQKLERIIRSVLAGQVLYRDKMQIKKMCRQLIKNQKADGVILGCTELPIVMGQINDPKIISSLEVLADNLLARYYNKEVI